MSWSSGYVTEVEYTFGYYPELHPDLLRLACLHAGFSCDLPERLTYLELGFGQGLPINIHAAALPARFWGTDFNPGQASHARALAKAAGSDAVLFDDSFADFAARTDLPEFDVIAFHGIWTWVSDENRKTIVDIVRRKLKLGGILYNSYNCRPGWAPAEPLRHLMTLYSELSAPGAAGTLANVDSALAFCQRIADAGALYFKTNPLVGERLKKIAAMNRNYLAHEYFNRNWELMSFSEMVKWLEPAKVTYAASAHLLDHVDAINLPEEGRQLLARTSHPVLRESVRDYFVNQQFRRDIFIKGPQRLSRLEQIERLRSQSFVLTTSPSEVSMKVAGAMAEATLQEEIYRPVIAAMAGNAFEVKTLAQLEQDASLKGMPLPQLIQAILVLIGAGNAFPARVPTKETVRRCAALNRYICNRARSHGDINYLAAPVSGAGVFVNRMQQLFLLAMDQKRSTVSEQVSFVWEILSLQGQQVIKDGKLLENPEDNIAELTRLANEFAEKRLPILRALGVALG